MPNPPFSTPALPNYFISSLAQTLNAGGGDTSIALGTIYTLDGQVITTSDFASFGRGILTVDPLNLNSVEFDSFTGVTPTTSPTGTVTGVKRGLSFKGDNQISANQKFHVVGTPVLIAFGTHNIIDLVSMINTTYTVLFNLIESAIIQGALPASTTVTGIARTTTDYKPTIGNPTISIANPAVITVANTLTAGDTVIFSTTGTLPSPIVAGAPYYVLSSGLSGSSFEISATFNGTPINTTGGTQSGTHTVKRTTPYAVTHDDPNVPYYYIDTGTANTYVITSFALFSAYTDGMQFKVKISHLNTGASTLNVNGVGAIPILKNISSPLTGGELPLNSIVELVYDSGNFQIQSITSATLGSVWQLVSTVTFNAVSVPNSTPTKIFEFTGLSGDTDDEYMIEFEEGASGSTGTGASLNMSFNADITANHYQYSNIINSATTTISANKAQDTVIRLATANTTIAVMDVVFGSVKIKASKTIAGTTRQSLSDITMSVLGGSAGVNFERGAGAWVNVANQLASIEVYLTQNSGVSITSSGKASLYKINR